MTQSITITLNSRWWGEHLQCEVTVTRVTRLISRTALPKRIHLPHDTALPIEPQTQPGFCHGTGFRIELVLGGLQMQCDGDSGAGQSDQPIWITMADCGCVQGMPMRLPKAFFPKARVGSPPGTLCKSKSC